MQKEVAIRPRPTRKIAQLLVTAHITVPMSTSAARMSSVRFLPHRPEALPHSGRVAAPTTRGRTHNGTVLGGSEPSAVALPPAAVPMVKRERPPPESRRPALFVFGQSSSPGGVT